MLKYSLLEEGASMLSIYLSMIDTDEEKSKFEQIYLTYKQVMFYAANSILKDEYMAEDCVHQAFLRIMNHLDKIKKMKCPKTRAFIVTIVQHLAIDIYRKRKRQGTVSFDEVSYAISDNSQEISEMSAVAKAIAKLPILLSTVIRLRYSQGYSVKEIAEILNVKEQTVYKRIQRAKAQLETILSNEEKVGSSEDYR